MHRARERAFPQNLCACNEVVEFTAPDGSVASFANVHGIFADLSAIKHFYAGASTDGAGAAAVVILAGMRVALQIDVEVLYAFSTMCFRHFSSLFYPKLTSVVRARLGPNLWAQAGSTYRSDTNCPECT